MIKKLSTVILISLLAFFLTGCVENKTNTASTQNQSIMDTKAPTTPQSTELQITTTKNGTGAAVKIGDNITVHYVGTFQNGTKFDSSRDRGNPFTFKIGQGSVIEGWDKGLIGMKVGEIRKLVVPPAMGYGDYDYNGIPGKSYLNFEVELLAIN